jgi:hypothetical protein
MHTTNYKKRKKNINKRSCSGDQNLLATAQTTSKIAPGVRSYKAIPSTKPLPGTTNQCWTLDFHPER